MSVPIPPHGPAPSVFLEWKEAPPMCDFRRVTVTFQDGREVRMFARVRVDGLKWCDPCKLGTPAFRRRQLTPHDTLEHLELYQGAKVQRSRRMSAAQVERAGLTEVFQAPAIRGRLIGTGPAGGT